MTQVSTLSEVQYDYASFLADTGRAGEAREWLSAQKPVDSTILIKGSRSMKMENLMDAFS